MRLAQALLFAFILLALPTTAHTPMRQLPQPHEANKPAIQHKQTPSRGTYQPRQYLGTFEATAYNLTRNRTTSGDKARIGIVAVDPAVIPLGTKLFVEGYGPALASDTGSRIVNYEVDVWLPKKEDCLKWGRRKVKVWVVD